MQARISHQGEVMVIHLSGRVDVETAQPFREACLNQIKAKKVVFDFQNLSFVGSSGILPFLDTLQSFALSNHSAFTFSGVGSEFRKIFAATALGTVQIYDGPVTASLALINDAAGLTSVVRPAPPMGLVADEPFFGDEFSDELSNASGCDLVQALSKVQEVSS
jgi:anti-anti-sigma factor